MSQNKHTSANEHKINHTVLMTQNQAYSCLCPRIKHTYAYESKLRILMLMSQNQAYSCLCIKTKHNYACIPETVSSYYLTQRHVTQCDVTKRDAT